MADVQCFLAERTDRAAYGLRRFRHGTDCNGTYHNAMTSLEEGPLQLSEEGYIQSTGIEKPPRDDPRWPAQCERCGEPFRDDDEWQVWVDPIYRRADTGEQWPMRALPPGAIYRAEWYERVADWTGPDGKSYVCILPGGYPWLIDGQASSGGKWTRSGEVPNFTTDPSILVPGKDGTELYHGWLVGGILRSTP